MSLTSIIRKKTYIIKNSSNFKGFWTLVKNTKRHRPQMQKARPHVWETEDV